MRELEILVSKEEYVPGDTVRGTLIIRTDDDFECQGAQITFRGDEVVKVVVHAGKVTIVHSDMREHANHTIDLVWDSIVASGETRKDFSFKLPENVPGSYDGILGRIRYVLEAQVQISWARDLKSELELKVVSIPSSMVFESRSQETLIEHNGEALLRVEATQDDVTIGDRFPFRLLISPRVKIRGVRAEIIGCEHVAPKGHARDAEKVLATSYIEDDHLRRDSWMDMTIQTDPSWRSPFKTELIDYTHRLKVTLDIPMRLDRKVVVPIRLSRRGELADKADLFGFWF